MIDTVITERVTAAARALEGEAVATLQRAVRIRSVNPGYPGVDPEEVRGGESEMARLAAEIHRAGGASAELLAAAPGRENCV